jgi:hypothetical protein
MNAKDFERELREIGVSRSEAEQIAAGYGLNGCVFDFVLALRYVVEALESSMLTS